MNSRKALTCSLTEILASLDLGLLGGLSTCRSGMRERLDRALLAVTSLDMAFTPTIGGDKEEKVHRRADENVCRRSFIFTVCVLFVHLFTVEVGVNYSGYISRKIT